jgi:hypothetical protein
MFAVCMASWSVYRRLAMGSTPVYKLQEPSKVPARQLVAKQLQVAARNGALPNNSLTAICNATLSVVELAASSWGSNS